MKIEITDKLYTDIVEYCKINNIEDVDKFIKRIINQGFTTEKWGTMSDTNNPKKEVVEKIIISAITTPPEIKIVEKIVVSAITNEQTKIVYSGDNKDVINVVYNINIKEPITKPIIEKKDNTDLYGERNVRKI
jgi:hypothetical protein